MSDGEECFCQWWPKGYESSRGEGDKVKDKISRLAIKIQELAHKAQNSNVGGGGRYYCSRYYEILCSARFVSGSCQSKG